MAIDIAPADRSQDLASEGPASPRLSLWQEISVVLEPRPELLAVVLPTAGVEVALFIADGYVEIAPIQVGRGYNNELAALRLAAPLKGELTHQLVQIGLLGASSQQPVRLFCHAVALAADRATIGVLASLSTSQSAVPKALREAAVMRISRYRSEIAQHRAIRSLEAQGQSDEAASPTLDMESLVNMMPPGVVARVSSFSTAWLKQVTRAIARNPDRLNPPPRDGVYRVLLAGADPRQVTAFVTWSAHRGPPTYSEIRAAAQRRLPSAFCRSFADESAHQVTLGSNGTRVVDANPFDPRDPAWVDAFAEGFDFEWSTRSGTTDSNPSTFDATTFDAIAAYRPHHEFGEGSWGIYFDAANLDHFASRLGADLAQAGFTRGTNAMAAKLAIGLVYEHALFHARFEAALTWFELTSGHSTYRRYRRNVYVHQRGTDTCLEDALAGFAASAWFSAESMMGVITGKMNVAEQEALDRVVQSHLDHASEVHRHWRRGRELEVWRRLASQAFSGKSSLPPPGIGLPIEFALREPLHFQFGALDVPLRVCGSGKVASCFLTAACTFSRPPRRELRVALTDSLKYVAVPNSSPSGHENFTGPNGSNFPLPRTDPVSPAVFGAFLDHFGLTPSDYLSKIRKTPFGTEIIATETSYLDGGDLAPL